MAGCDDTVKEITITISDRGHPQESRDKALNEMRDAISTRVNDQLKCSQGDCSGALKCQVVIEDAEKLDGFIHIGTIFSTGRLPQYVGRVDASGAGIKVSCYCNCAPLAAVVAIPVAAPAASDAGGLSHW